MDVTEVTVEFRGGNLVKDPTVHTCNPGWTAVDGRLLIVHATPGDRWECDCGLAYVAYDRGVGHCQPGWRADTRRDRKRRMRDHRPESRR